LKILNLHEDVIITKVPSAYFKSTYFADRPANERLINRKLNIRNLNLMRDWRIALKEYIENYYQDYLA
jgi:dTDP-4-dehydrorhamnose reductase